MSDDLGVQAGQVIAETYRLKDLLGRGGMGSVWRCDHLKLMSEVALKVIKPEVAKNKNSVNRFMREAKAAAMLRSPHVVQILDHGMQGSIAYIAMELLEGESLYARLKRQKTVPAVATARIMTHVGRAMQKAHEMGIIHRDLKPDNVFLVENDDEIIAKVLDFGIAKSSVYALSSTGESPQTQTGALLGTPYYMSPEQATGQKSVDHRSDLWALAVITFECLIGRRPYQSDSLGDLVLQICSRPQPVPSHLGRVPPGFDAWFKKAQERDPDDRFQSAKELTAALREVLTGDRRSSVQGLPRPAMPRRPSFPPGALPDGPKRREMTQTADSSSQQAAHATPFDSASSLSSGQHAAMTASSPNVPRPMMTSEASTSGGVGLETLDPLAATTSPGRRTGLLLGGVIGAIGIFGGVGAGIYLSTTGEPRPAAAPAISAQEEERPKEPAPEPEPEPEPEPVPAPPEPSAEPAESAVAKDKPPAAPLRPFPPPPRTQPPKPAAPPPPRPPPPRPPPPPPKDPLGI